MGYPLLAIMRINAAAIELQRAMEDVGRGDLAARVALLVINLLIEDLENGALDETEAEAVSRLRGYRDQALLLMEQQDRVVEEEKAEDKADFPPVMIVNRGEEDIVH